MGLFTDYFYKWVPFTDLSLQEVEKVAKHHFPKHSIYIKNDKLFIKSNKLLDLRRYEFRANAEITINKQKLCFKTKINKRTLISVFIIFVFVIALFTTEIYHDYKSVASFLTPGVATSNFELFSISKVLLLYLIIFFSIAIGISFRLHRTSRFLVKTIITALEIYRERNANHKE